MAKQRWALGVSYEGTHYHGWQIQKDLDATIQHHVELALAKFFDEPVKVICAGRTDTGVHGTGQVIHVDVEHDRKPFNVILGVNSYLPADISINWAQKVDQDFHARFSASKRRYRYILYNHQARPGILCNQVAWECRPLNITAMQQAAAYLVGEHDFSAFRGAGCQAHSPIRTINRCSLSQIKDMIVLDIEANAFLMHMVRNIMGSLKEVGVGKQSALWFKKVLESKDRKQAGPTASPKGLYLIDVTFENYQLPKLPLGPFFIETN